MKSEVLIKRILRRRGWEAALSSAKELRKMAPEETQQALFDIRRDLLVCDFCGKEFCYCDSER